MYRQDQGNPGDEKEIGRLVANISARFALNLQTLNCKTVSDGDCMYGILQHRFRHAYGER